MQPYAKLQQSIETKGENREHLGTFSRAEVVGSIPADSYIVGISTKEHCIFQCSVLLLIRALSLSIMATNLCTGVNVISSGSPSRIRMVRRISLGITTRPRSSIRRTIPVAFILKIPPVKAKFTRVVFTAGNFLCLTSFYHEKRPPKRYFRLDLKLAAYVKKRMLQKR